jgi:hypothetical protein
LPNSVLLSSRALSSRLKSEVALIVFIIVANSPFEMSCPRPARMIIAMLVALSLLTACAQPSWKEYNDAGFEAKEQARYAEAEELFLAGLEEAKEFEDLDPRFATSLNNLAEVYR